MNIYDFKDLSHYEKLQKSPKEKYYCCVCEYTHLLNALAYELELCMKNISDPTIKAYALELLNKYENLKSLKF